MTTAGFYDAIAPIYDEWHSWNGMTPFARVAATKLAPLLDRESAAAERTHRDRPALLDVGCGTGTLLLDIARTNPSWRLAGADGSAGMLAVGRAKAAGTAEIHWARAALDALPFASAFDVCTAFYDTLNHLPDPEALARAFAAAASVLRTGGLLVFDVTNRLGFEEWWATSTLFRGSDWQVLLDNRFDSGRGVAVSDVTLIRAHRKSHFQIRERHFDRNEINLALRSAGFTAEQEYSWEPFPVGGPGKTWWAARLG